MAQQTSVSSLLDMTSSSNVVFLGEAGSGKSEIALNFAQALAELGGKPVHFFDLDMTKPLFRSRDRREALEALGVEVHYEAQFMDALVTSCTSSRSFCSWLMAPSSVRAIPAAISGFPARTLPRMPPLSSRRSFSATTGIRYSAMES